MPVDTRDLCTVADVRAQMQTVASNTGQNTLIQDFITDASQLLMDEYEQEWAPVTTGAARSFEFPWEGELMSLAPYALQPSPTPTVVVDSDQGAGVTLSTDEWRPWPQPARDGVVLSLHLRPFSAAFGRVTFRNRKVTVTGTWGYPAIPRPVKRACVHTVVHWMTVNTAGYRHADDSPDSMAPPKRGIPPEAREMLRRYRRAVV